MPNSLYMNIVRVDCTSINEFLIEQLEKFINNLISYILSYNINKKSKDLTDEIDSLKETLNTVPQDEESLNYLELEYEKTDTETVPKLYAKYEDFIEWIFFYFSYDTYQLFSQNKNVESVSGIENTIRGVYSTINMIQGDMEKAKNVLSDKREAFEAKLNQEKARLDKVVKEEIRGKLEKYKVNGKTQVKSEKEVLDNLEELEKQIEKTYAEYLLLNKNEETMGKYKTDTETLDNCKFELIPNLHCMQFFMKHNSLISKIKGMTKIIDFDISLLDEYFTESKQYIDVIYPKLASKGTKLPSINQVSHYANICRVGKLVYSVIEICESVEEEDFATNDLLKENLIYQKHMAEMLFHHEKDMRHVTLLELQNTDFIKKEVAVEQEQELFDLVGEWEKVNKIFDDLSKIGEATDIEFETQNFMDKKYVVIKHESFEKIKEVLKENIAILNENVTSSSVNRYR